MIDVTGLRIKLSGYNVAFRVVKDKNGATMEIETPERNIFILMTEGQYAALDAALNDVADTYDGDTAIGEWFGDPGVSEVEVIHRPREPKVTACGHDE